jgi:hypothetical protein
VIEGDVVRRRTVRIGERNEQLAEVLEGLQPGDKWSHIRGKASRMGQK